MNIKLKKAAALFAAAVMAVSALTGCSKADADTNIEDRVAKLEQKVADMESRLASVEVNQPQVGGALEKQAEASYPVADISNINIDVVFADTEVKASTDNTIKVVCYTNLKSDAGNLSITMKDGAIKVYQQKMDNMVWNTFKNIQAKTEIYLPASYNGNISLDTTSGSIIADKLTLKSLNMDATSGDVNIEELTAEKLIVDSTSGDVFIGVFRGTADIDLTSGDVYMGIADAGDHIMIDTTSGDVELAIGENIGVNLKFGSTSGDIETYFNDKTDREFKSVGRQLGNAPYTDVKAYTTSGDIKITKGNF